MAEVNLMPGEQAKIEAAYEALAADAHAPREISVRVAIHKHHEYPKHVTVPGKDKNGNPIVKVVHSKQEEEALSGNGNGAA